MTWYRIFLFSVVLACPVFGQLLAENDPCLPGNPPKLEVGITTCDDGSRWHAFTFQTIAGLSYVVESGNDLTGWTDEDSIYGFGQEEVVLMKQAPALPVPPPPGTTHTSPPMIRAKFAQLVMRPAIGGGLVLTWKSLDDYSTKTQHFPLLTMASAWNYMPGYVRRFGDYDFFLSNPLLPRIPPSTPPSLGPLDTDMLEAFEGNFTEMNADVVSAIVRSRTAPRFPDPPTEKRFWRVRVDWNLDSDLDGTPDWMEFAQLFAAGAGNNPVAGPEPDPFNMDVNEDGVADGAQRSSDGDDTADDVDADKMDGLIDWLKCPEYRYAIFQVVTGDSDTGPPIKTDNFGQVLFTHGQWGAGSYSSLGAGATALTSNDYGNILGTITTDGITSNLLNWKTIVYAPTAVITGDSIAGGTVSVVIPQGGLGFAAPFSHYGIDGSFIADTLAYEADENENQVLTFQHRAKWQINATTDAITESQVEAGTISLDDSHFSWGLDYDSPYHPSPTFLKWPIGTKTTWDWGDFSHVTTMPNGTSVASGGQPNLLRISHPNNWQTPRRFKSATDVSPEGIIIKQGSAPVWMNGRERQTASIAPQYSGNPAIVPLDISQNGCILAYDPGESCEPFYLSGIPFYVESMYNGLYGKSLGVDNVSVGSEASGTARDRLWIMVPEGRNDSILIHSGASLTHPMQISATGVALNGIANTPLSIPDEPVTITADTGAAQGQEVDLDIKLQSGQGSLSKPIGLKLMKHRTLEVAVWYIDSELAPTPEHPSNIYVSTFSPTEAEIEAYLDSIYLPQVNVNFNVTIHAEHIPVAWDRRPDGTAGIGNEQLDGDQVPTSEQKAITDVAKDSAADINVYWVGGKYPFYGEDFGANGTCNPNKEDRNAWLVGSPYADSITLPKMLHAMAHEIAHVMMGKDNVGHPNDPKIQGPAPLPGTRITDRLLCRGSAVIPGTKPRILVKGEWDEMEKWLQDRVDSRN